MNTDEHRKKDLPGTRIVSNSGNKIDRVKSEIRQRELKNDKKTKQLKIISTHLFTSQTCVSDQFTTKKNPCWSMS